MKYHVSVSLRHAKLHPEIFDAPKPDGLEYIKELEGKGYKAVPLNDCDNVQPDGTCGGHEK